MQRIGQRHAVVQQTNRILGRHDARRGAPLEHDHRVVRIHQQRQRLAKRRIVRQFLHRMPAQQIAQLLALEHQLRVETAENVGIGHDAEQAACRVDHGGIAVWAVEQFEHVQKTASLRYAGKRVIAGLADSDVEIRHREPKPHHIGRGQQAETAGRLLDHDIADRALRHLPQRVAHGESRRHAHDVGRGQFIDKRKKHGCLRSLPARPRLADSVIRFGLPGPPGIFV